MPLEQNQEDEGTSAAPDFAALSREEAGETGDAGASHSTSQLLPAVPAAALSDDAPAKPAVAIDVADTAGVATPDGKHIIPAAELTNTRRKNTELKASVDQLTETNLALAEQLRAATEQLKAKPADGQAADAAQAVVDAAAAAGKSGANVGDAIESALAEIDAEAPWLGVAVRKLMAPLIAKADESGQFAEQVRTMKAERDQFVQRQQATVAEQVQEAIDNTPIVAHWQSEGGEAWAEARRVDEILRGQKAWADKPMVERFAEVQRRVVAMLGDEYVPESLKKFAEVPKKGPTDQQVIAAGKAKLEGATRSLTTLSDIPGGTPAAGTVNDALANDDLSISQLEDYARNKSTDDLLGMFRL